MQLNSRRRRGIAVLTAIVLAATVATPAFAKGPKGPKPVEIQILGLNDFHGQLEVVDPTASSAGRIGFLVPPFPATPQFCLVGNCVPAGGVEYLATHVRDLRATNPKNTVFVSAGDLVGATPLLSALFHDEPTIEAFNMMKLDYNGVGNHEFDEGIDELLRLAYGRNARAGYVPDRADGCHPVDECGDLDDYRGAKFPFLAANVIYRDSGKTIFPPYAVQKFQGIKVAFIGMTLEGTPDIVSPDGIQSVRFLDEADTVNALVPVLKAQGVEAFVVLLHEGGVVGPGNGGPGTTGDPALINTCDNPRGALPPIVEAMDDEIDIVITGHTNWAVDCVIDGKTVTGAAAQGRLVTDIDAKLDRKSGDFIKPISVNNHIVTRDVPKASDLSALIAEYKVFEGPVAAVVVGNTLTTLTRTQNAAGESDLGRLIADAQVVHPSVAGSQIAFMNPGGIRSDLNAGTITHGEAFGVQPFSNVLMARAFTRAEIDAILERQFRADPTQNVMLAVSKGFSYSWDSTAAVGSRIDPLSIKLNGVVLDPAIEYKVAMNNFLGGGGDGFTTQMLAGPIVDGGEDDLVALEDFLAPTIPPGAPYDKATSGPPRVTVLPVP